MAIRLRILTLFTVTAFLAGCAPLVAAPAPASQAAVQITDGTGVVVDLAQPASRIVSLGPSNTEILFAVGAGDQIVACDQFSDYPEAAKPLATIAAGYGSLNVEAIVAAKPDLVLAAEIISRDQVESMRALGLKVFWLSNPKDLDGLYANLRTAGRLAGRETEADRKATELANRAASILARISAAIETPLVYYELDATNPAQPYTPGPGTILDRLIRLAGGKNLGGGLATEWAQISTEEIVRLDPEIILLGDANYGVTADSVKARPGWEGLRAVRTGAVFPVDDNLFSRFGPRLIDGLEFLAKTLHPDLMQ